MLKNITMARHYTDTQQFVAKNYKYQRPLFYNINTAINLLF